MPEQMAEQDLLIVLFGASGDLACKKIFPALWILHKLKMLSKRTRIVGFARSEHTSRSLAGVFKASCKVSTEEEESEFEEFTRRVVYFQGSYDSGPFDDLKRMLERDLPHLNDRIFYFALPPSVYSTAAALVRQFLFNNPGMKRIVLEKPFGYDFDTAVELNKRLLGLFSEDHIYRIDHYLGKDMVQNILVCRFANLFTSSLWNNKYVSSVLINFKEDIGTFGRGNYYDGSGVIRDIIQSHSMQVFALLAMEQPKSLTHSDVKDAKVAVLNNILPIKLEDIVLGQYVGDVSCEEGNHRRKGYKDDPLVPQDSKTPTFVTMVLYIDNERWRGVPFILRAGKALNERKAEIRVQFKDVQPKLFDKASPNELVIRIQPSEAIYLKIQTKLPGFKFELATTELDLTFKDRHKEFRSHDAYEKLILDVIQGTHINFVRSDEIEGSWKLLSPLLDELSRKNIVPTNYVFGSRGPSEADELMQKVGFFKDSNYTWNK